MPDESHKLQWAKVVVPAVVAVVTSGGISLAVAIIGSGNASEDRSSREIIVALESARSEATEAKAEAAALRLEVREIRTTNNRLWAEVQMLRRIIAEAGLELPTESRRPWLPEDTLHAWAKKETDTFDLLDGALLGFDADGGVSDE